MKKNSPPSSFLLRAAAVFAVCGAFTQSPVWAADKTVVRLSIIDPLLTELTTSLGHFESEGLAVELVKVESVAPADYLMQEPLINGRLDASYHWFHHVIFGQRHNLPVKAVLKVCDSPGMKVLVANRLKDQVRSAADFKGRHIAEGAGYATKSVLMNYLARQAGLPRGSYTPVNLEVDGRLENILQGLQEGRVDIMAFMEPMTSALLASNQVSVLFDLATKEGTIAALGDAWPAQCLFLSERFIAEHPDTVQRLVNAYVRTLRYVNAHPAGEIAARLPAAYFAGKDRAKETERIGKFLSNVARDDYAFTSSSAQLVLDTVLTSAFDESVEGRFRATGENGRVTAESLYTNRFVTRAMQEIK
jgi:NitT/TauT family transport system substrate-binding protein